MTSRRKTKPPKPDKTPAAADTIWLNHDPAIARLEIIAWLAYPRADPMKKAFNRLMWWPAMERGHTVPEKPARLKERHAAIGRRLRERLLAGSLYAAKARRYLRSQPPWDDLPLPTDLARIVEAADAAMHNAQPPGTLDLLRRIADVRAAGDRTWFRKLTAESSPVVHLAAAWVEHASVRFDADLRAMAFDARPAGEMAAILRNAELLRSRIAADPSNNMAADAMLRFAQNPAVLAD